MNAEQREAKPRSWFSLVSPSQKTFIANVLTSSFSILLLQAGRRRSERLRNIPRPGAIPIPYTYTPSSPQIAPSPTLDLTLLVIVRAIDVAVQSVILKFTTKTKPKTLAEPGVKAQLTTRLDALVFWACSARSAQSLDILFCSVNQYLPTLALCGAFSICLKGMYS